VSANDTHFTLMPWYSKERPTPFDAVPIEGLFFLDGDRVGLKRQKYSMIDFPSGVQCPLWESGDPERVGTVHLFGEMDLPLVDTREGAFEQASRIAAACGYRARRVGEDRLEVRGRDPGEHFRVRYDPENGQMADVEPVVDSSEPPPVPPAHQLLSAEIRAQLPELYSGEKQGLETRAVVKFFTPDSSWSWFASEGSPVDEDGYYDTDKEKVDYLFFGLVVGLEIELGYFSLAELESARGPLGLPIERDLYYEPKSLKELMDWHREQRGGR
jgi:hypothetical protein